MVRCSDDHTCFASSGKETNQYGGFGIQGDTQNGFILFCLFVHLF